MDEDAKEQQIDEALAELDRAASAYRRAKTRLEQQQDAVHAAIIKAFKAGARPSDVERVSPYDRNHNGRIRDAAGIPATRPATVRSIKEKP